MGKKNIEIRGIQSLTVDSEGQEFCDPVAKFYQNKLASLYSEAIKSLSFLI